MNRTLVGGAFALLLASIAMPQAAVPNLSRSEQTERTRLLPEDEQRWLEFVEPIIFSNERNFFLLLAEPHQREIFREEFWKRREKPELPPPLGAGYRHRYAELLQRANEVYDGWRQDAGQMVIAHGEPASLEVVEACDDIFRHLEIWTYSNPVRGFPGRRTSFFFYSLAPLSPRKLWSIGDRYDQIFAPGSCRKTFDDLHLDCVPQLFDRCRTRNPECACHVYKVYLEISARQSSAMGGSNERAMALAPPTVATEDLAALAAKFPGIPDPRAKPIAVESAGTRPGAPANVAPKADHPFTYEEIRNRIVELPPKYRQWLDLAAPLLTAADLVRFLQLSAGERDRFIREFFKRRS